MVGEILQGIGSIAGAAGQIGLGAKQLKAEQERFNQQLAWEREAYERDMQNSWDMFHATNAWNSETAQAERKKAAGINPQLDGLNASTASAVSLPQGSAYGEAYKRPTPNYSELGNQVMQAMSSLGAMASMFEDLRAKRLQNDKIEMSTFDDVLAKSIGDEDLVKMRSIFDGLKSEGMTESDINGELLGALKSIGKNETLGGRLAASSVDTSYLQTLSEKLLSMNPYPMNRKKRERYLRYALNQFRSDYLSSQTSGNARTTRENRKESTLIDSDYRFRGKRPYGFNQEIYDMTKSLYELEKTRIGSEKQSYITSEMQKTIEENKRTMMFDLTNKAKKIIDNPKASTVDKVGGYFLMSLAIMLDNGNFSYTGRNGKKGSFSLGF